MAEDLIPITRLVVAEDGVIGITQNQDGAMRFYSATGERLGSFGRRGSGPGEFEGFGFLGWVADTLWLSDSRLRRVTVLEPDRTTFRTFQPPDVTGLDSSIALSFVAPVGMRPGGSFVIPLTAVSDTNRESFYALVAVDGRIDRVLAKIPPQEVREARVDGGVAYGPFGNRPFDAVSPDGERLVFGMASVQGEHAGTFLLTSMTTNGDTIFSRRYAFEVEAIPDAVADSVIAQSVARVREMNPQLANELERVSVAPAMYPPFAALTIGLDGTIWLWGRNRDQGRTFHVLEAEGDPLGTLVLPRGVTLGASERERIWVMEANEVGVQSVVRYRVGWQAD